MEMDYDGTKPLVVPMCGSGTIGIEAALMAKGCAPGLLRENFSFMHFLAYDNERWGKERLAAKKLMKKEEIAPIVLSDIDPDCVSASKKNAISAGVDHLLEFHVCDFTDTPMPETPGAVVLHGPYGMRLGKEELPMDYKRIGDYLKTNCVGWDGYVFTSGKQLIAAIGLKVAKRTPFMNADVDCRLLRYELYQGSRPLKNPA